MARRWHRRLTWSSPRAHAVEPRRQTAAAAARLGVACEILLEDRTGSTQPDYRISGNVLLDRLLGGTLHHFPWHRHGRSMARRAEELRASQAPVRDPGGGSNRSGAGYVTSALELVEQANVAGLDIDLLVTATGSTGTQAGLLRASRAVAAAFRCSDLCARAKSVQEDRSSHWRSARQTCWVFRRRVARARRGQFRLRRQRYGVPTDGMFEALELVARTEASCSTGVFGQGDGWTDRLIRRDQFAPRRTSCFCTLARRRPVRIRSRVCARLGLA